MIPNTGGVRRRRVEHARERLCEVSARLAGRALVLSGSAAVAWATGAISTPIDRVAPSDPLWVVFRDGTMTLVTSSVEMERIAQDYPLDELGFSLVEAPWYELDAHQRRSLGLAGDALASDVPGLGVDLTFEVTRARLGLGQGEREVLEALALVATDAVESVLHQWRPGVLSDHEIAAQVVGHLEAHGADAVCLIVGGDDRLARFRHPVMIGATPRETLMVVVVARALGLHVALTRIASVDERFERELFEKCETINEHVRAALEVGAPWGRVYEALAAGYAAVGQPEAWREHFQGGPLGYAQREFELSPLATDSPWWCEPIPAGCAVAFNPSLRGGAKIEDTLVVDEGALTCVTSRPQWPRLAGATSGTAVIPAREEKTT